MKGCVELLRMRDDGVCWDNEDGIEGVSWDDRSEGMY